MPRAHKESGDSSINEMAIVDTFTKLIFGEEDGYSRRELSIIQALPQTNLLAGVGIGMIAALWTYDGWYGATFSAGEMRDPQRTLPFGLVWGTVIVMVLYALINLVYFVALPVDVMGDTPRIGETAAAMNQLALRGQVIFDLHAGAYRWRQVTLLPVAGTCALLAVRCFDRSYFSAPGLDERSGRQPGQKDRYPVCRVGFRIADPAGARRGVRANPAR